MCVRAYLLAADAMPFVDADAHGAGPPSGGGGGEFVGGRVRAGVQPTAINQNQTRMV